MHILLIEDEAELAATLKSALQRERYVVDLANTLALAREAALSGSHDLVLLDRTLPDGDGLGLIQGLRGHYPGVPIIVLSALGQLPDRIAGLDEGADDYLAKPFSPRELKARITAVLRRFEEVPEATAPTLTLGALTLDPASGRVRLDGEDILLTGAEQRILELLMRAPGQVIAREQIGMYALGRRPERYDRSIDTHISTLRKKLHLDASGDSLSIRNLRGLGYVLAGAA
ncbi:hypothetical protein G6F68_013322 [Rhizopus microsporus]|nr:hypothetical protein G6F68_013322 [Rhizopus microsporus]